MVDSTVTAWRLEDKMGETATSNPALHLSVSFGRFENDSLSWEKWSSFSPNKYLEEVEKCATPGSVAQKKAYFEAHYRKIAARKAELLDQEKQMSHDSLRSDDHNNGDLLGKPCGTKSEFGNFGGQTSEEAIWEETELKSELDSAGVDECDEDATNVKVHDSSSEVIEELDNKFDISELNKMEEAPVVKEQENQPLESQDMKALAKSLEKEVEKFPANKGKTNKLDRQKGSQKNTPLGKVTDVARAKKKPALPVTRTPQTSTAKASTQASTAKASKPVFTSSALSTSRTWTRNSISSSLSKSKVPSAGESKKMAHKSLHMSLSLDPPSSNPAPLTTTRKSLIMEKMGDKDIVKRAFKTFQCSFNQLKSSSEDRSVGTKQVSTKGTEVRVSTALTPRKENGGSLKAVSMDKKTAKVAPSLGQRSDEKAVKSREFNEKLEEKSKTKEAGITHLRAKSKEDKEGETRKLRQSLNFKAMPLSSSYRVQRVSKSPLDKMGSKTVGI